MSLFTNKQERIRFLKFAFVGVTGTVVDFGLMNLLRLVFDIPLIWAQAISFTVAVFNNFLWNRFWTYPDSRSKAAHRQLIQFFLINVVGIAVRTPLITWLDKVILGLLDSNAVSLPLENFVISQNLALALSVGVIMLWNFFANRYWTYSDVPVGAEVTKTTEDPAQSTGEGN
ncbi:MAG: GtrA family protein [Anaerolineaceae bacterium]|nr:GtrA family protein [Anaerolineaceae bacterium]